MGSLVVRKVQPEDQEGFARVRSMVYGGGKPVSVDELLSSGHAAFYVVRDDSRVLGTLDAIDMLASKGVENLRCAGIAAVGVLPEARRSGVGSELMWRSLRLLKDEGFTLASLYAFREPYYRKFGYEVCGKVVKIQCPADRLPRFRDTLPVRALDPSEFDLLRPVMAKFCVRYAGGNIRNDAQWPRILGGDKPKTVFVAGDPIEAYAIMDLSGNFWDDQDVYEFVYTSLAGYQAILETFRCLAMNKTAVSWKEPSDGPFFGCHLDYPVRAELARQIMFRVLDVPGALAALHPGGSGEIVLAVDDPDLPENGGPWHVEYEFGHVLVSPTDEEPDVVMDIKRFTQAFMGEPSLKDLARNGLVAFDHPASLIAADTLLPPTPVVCWDTF